MIDYILSLTEPCLIIQGIRAKESEERAKLPYECNYFGEYFERVKKNRKGKIVEVWKQDYRRKDVLKWCEHYDASVSRPIFQWSAQEVIDQILSVGQKPNPLYYRGFSRVGCYPVLCAGARGQVILKKSLAESLDRCRTANERRNPKVRLSSHQLHP